MSATVVKRLYASLAVTPEAAAGGKWRVQLLCSRCMVSRDLPVTPGGRLQRYWFEDFEAIFRKVRFKCRCGSPASAMRVRRATRDASETLLLISGRGEYHG